MSDADEYPKNYHEVLMLYLNDTGTLQEKAGYYLFSIGKPALHKLTKVRQDCVVIEVIANTRILVIPFNLFVVAKGD